MRRRLLHADDGFTLPELIMYGMLLTIVLAVAAGIMMSGTIAERTVRTVVGASTESQLASDSIETGIRNSSGYSVTVPSVGTQLLRARVAQGTTSVVWTCAAWYYTPNVANGSIWYKSSTTAIAAPTTSTLSTWTLLVDDVIPASGTTVFSTGSDQLSFAFKTLAGDDPPASASSSATSRADTWETAPCF